MNYTDENFRTCYLNHKIDTPYKSSGLLGFIPPNLLLLPSNLSSAFFAHILSPRPIIKSIYEPSGLPTP